MPDVAAMQPTEKLRLPTLALARRTERANDITPGETPLALRRTRPRRAAGAPARAGKWEPMCHGRRAIKTQRAPQLRGQRTARPEGGGYARSPRPAHGRRARALLRLAALAALEWKASGNLGQTSLLCAWSR